MFSCPRVSAGETVVSTSYKSFLHRLEAEHFQEGLSGLPNSNKWVLIELTTQKPCIVRLKLSWNCLSAKNCSSFLKEASQLQINLLLSHL